MNFRTNRPFAIWISIAAVVSAAWAVAGGWPFGQLLLSISAVSNALGAVYLWRHADDPLIFWSLGNWRRQ
jgi:hypothetical protein